MILLYKARSIEGSASLSKKLSSQQVVSTWSRKAGDTTLLFNADLLRRCKLTSRKL